MWNKYKLENWLRYISYLLKTEMQQKRFKFLTLPVQKVKNKTKNHFEGSYYFFELVI
jgi:hypothetical protein